MTLSQSQFPDMPRDRSLPVVQPHGAPVAASAADARADYGGVSGAHYMDGGIHGKHSAPNPLAQRIHDVVGLRAGRSRTSRREFVPTERLQSHQPTINQKAVDHQVANADPWDLDELPMMDAVGNDFIVKDGNHRANAALQRGQLFMEADVTRYASDTPSLGAVTDHLWSKWDTGETQHPGLPAHSEPTSSDKRRYPADSKWLDGIWSDE